MQCFLSLYVVKRDYLLTTCAKNAIAPWHIQNILVFLNIGGIYFNVGKFYKYLPRWTLTCIFR